MLSTKDLRKLEAAQNVLQLNNYGTDKDRYGINKNLTRPAAAQNLLL
jgi:hypothetical protein